MMMSRMPTQACRNTLISATKVASLKICSENNAFQIARSMPGVNSRTPSRRTRYAAITTAVIRCMSQSESP